MSRFKSTTDEIKPVISLWTNEYGYDIDIIQDPYGVCLEITINDGREEITYRHYQEGADDMPAHIKTTLTNACLSLSFQEGKIMLGTWQAVYLWEHRFEQKQRLINVHIVGEKKVKYL